LKHSLSLSIAPAAGVVAGASATAAISVASAPSANLTVTLSAPDGYASAPTTVTIPAGAHNASFAITGAKPGVEDIQATPADPVYETAFARIQVADASLLQLTAVSTSPVTVRLTDANHLLYAGVRITAAASTGGTVLPAIATTDASGIASFQWTPGAAPVNQLYLAVEAFPSVTLDLQAGSAVPVITAVVNAASWQPGLAPGAIEAIFGANLAAGQTAAAPYPWPTSLGGVTVLVNGAPAQLLYVSDSQINFLAPLTAATGAETITVVTPTGAKPSYAVTATAYQPGIFAISGPVHPGDSFEIWCTGLSSQDFLPASAYPLVFIGEYPVPPVLSATTAPGYPGLFELTAQVPSELAPGTYPVFLSVAGAHSNAANLTVQ
jgi:uncharacterized protein (TIGR03437 family)